MATKVEINMADPYNTVLYPESFKLLKDGYTRVLQANYVHTENDGDYAVYREGNAIYCCFQWSNSTLDWWSNFDFPAVSYKNCDHKWRVHRGFLRVWKTMRDAVEAKVQKYIDDPTHPITEIYCLGYSHGAAIAGLCTEDMMYLYGRKVMVTGVGFACPRFMWGRIPKCVKERMSVFMMTRIRNDIVTHVPPALFGFSHRYLMYQFKSIDNYNIIDAHRPQSYCKVLGIDESLIPPTLLD